MTANENVEYEANMEQLSDEEFVRALEALADMLTGKRNAVISDRARELGVTQEQADEVAATAMEVYARVVERAGAMAEAHGVFSEDAMAVFASVANDCVSAAAAYRG